MERMAEAVPDSDEQVLQNFLTHSAWDYRGVMEQVAINANRCVGSEVGAGLYVDESAFQKKGEKSVGVARQWNGRLGKQDNCQVGVFGALGRSDRVSLIDARLYLPEEWTKDRRRCDEADIPEAPAHHKTKIELALEIVLHARRSGVRFEWVGVDGGYRTIFCAAANAGGSRRGLCSGHSLGSAHLCARSRVVPACAESRSWPPTRHLCERHALDGSAQVGKKKPASAWQKKTLRDTTKGRLAIEVLHRRVWLSRKRARPRDLASDSSPRIDSPERSNTLSATRPRPPASPSSQKCRRSAFGLSARFRMRKPPWPWHNIRRVNGDPGIATWLWQ